jgi:hypothetical protein
MDIFLIILGLAFLIASMALILNPPEAWVKRAFLRNAAKRERQQHASTQKQTQTPGKHDRT